ncbi:hypothetical protein QYE76_051764 [Lolium multiflorum]|uniref:Uncharacterized protein n=1 Tax=Lolium multiflorum TaxID=4521 RepID=A0AAD8STE5_LOLMU|nr:hypothetical protein QYE76_051764 [Lolium multiflorum]
MPAAPPCIPEPPLRPPRAIDQHLSPNQPPSARRRNRRLAHQMQRRRAAVLAPWHTSTTGLQVPDLPPTVALRSLHATSAPRRSQPPKPHHHRVPGAAAPACERPASSNPEQAQIGPAQTQIEPGSTTEQQPRRGADADACRAAPLADAEDPPPALTTAVRPPREAEQTEAGRRPHRVHRSSPPATFGGGSRRHRGEASGSGGGGEDAWGASGGADAAPPSRPLRATRGLFSVSYS